MSKTVERLVCRQLVNFLERNNLLPSHRSAYRRYHWTETAMLKSPRICFWRAIVAKYHCLLYSICRPHSIQWTTKFCLAVYTKPSEFVEALLNGSNPLSLTACKQSSSPARSQSSPECYVVSPMAVSWARYYSCYALRSRLSLSVTISTAIHTLTILNYISTAT